MGSDELSANLFRISQTNQKLKNDNINNEVDANKTHYEVGSKVRQTIKELVELCLRIYQYRLNQ